jgi:hypothetical protein
VIYAKDLGCEQDVFCQKTIVLDKWSFPSNTTYTILGALILNTESQDYNNQLTLNTLNISTTYYSFETARVLQVFERRDLLYKNSETIPLVLQVREDNLRNLKNEYSVYLEIDVNSKGTYTTINQKFNPTKFVYDDVTGYNYWYWNNLFFNDAGSLIPDGNALRFKAYAVPLKSAVASSQAYGLTNKCQVYPSDHNVFGFLMNWSGLINSGLDATFGCTNVSNPVITWDDLNAVQITMSNSHSVQALQNQSLFCFRADVNQQYHAELGDDFICGLLYKKSEEQIDKFEIKLGNSYSDYSKKGDESQYISASIPIEEVMFNDIALMSSALEFEAGTEGTHTWKDLFFYGVNKIFSLAGTYDYLNNKTEFASYLVGEGLVKNVGWDLNFDEAVNPNTFNGVFFFKVDGMKVTNQYDYVNDYPDLENLNPSSFRTYALANKIFLPKKTATITIYSRDFQPISSEKLSSPLVIFEKPKQANNNLDANVSSIKPTTLKFNFISDMFSANQTKAVRSVVPIMFSYIVPPTPFSFKDFTDGLNSFINNPVSFITSGIVSNWFIIVILIMFVLVVSLIYSNFKGGGSTININK